MRSPKNFMKMLLSVVACALALLPRAALAQGPLTNGGSQAGAISTVGELDAWTFTAALGDYISVSIGEKLPAGPDPGFAPGIRLRRPDGVEVGYSAGLVSARIDVAATLSGTYTVIVADHWAQTTGNYILHLIKAPGTFAAPTGDEGGLITNGANHGGRIGALAGQPLTDDPGDQDPWTFTASQNDYLTISIGEVPPGEIDPGFVPYIRLIGPTGTLVGASSGALSGRIDVLAPLTGTYTVIVADYWGQKTGEYILHLIKAPGTLVVPAGDEGGAMTNGANHGGRIGALAGQPIVNDPGDQDPWTFTASQNDYLSISIGEIPPGEIDPGFVPYIRLIGPTGTLVGADSGARSGRIDVLAPLTGTYTVVVADYWGQKTGNYILHLIKAPGTFVVPAGDEGGAMTNGFQHSARIGAVEGQEIERDPGDQDPWTFRANQGNPLLISIGEVPPGEIDPGFTPSIRLIGPTGTLVAASQGALSAQINRNAPLSGRYTVIVSDYNASVTGSYRLTLVCPTCPPDVDPFTVTPSVVGNGTISPSTPQSVLPGATTPFTVTPAGGHVIQSVGGTCGGTLVGQTFTTSPITTNCTVIATFVVVSTFTVTPSVVGNGTIDPSTAVPAASGATRSFTLAPAANHFVSGVTGTCGGNLVGFVFTTTPVTANCTVVATFEPRRVTLDKTALTFGAVTNGASFVSQTPAQLVRLTQTGPGTVTWTATPSQPWLQMTPASGSGSANLSFRIVAVPGLPVNGTVSASVTFAFTGAANTAGPITVALNLVGNGTSTMPIGTVDTPTNNRTGVTGAVPFTGWAVDDIGVTRIMVCRSAFGAEVAAADPNCGGAAQVFVGFAVSIDGARPDVVTAYPTYPANTTAGWGFMVLTNMLPNQGNGTYVFHVYAEDVDGHTVLLGTRTMTCANASATLPFGAIDTPTQGGVASGGAYLNFGWALTPRPKTIPTSGATITVLVDGVSQGTADYNHFRSDIAGLFPGLNNTGGAVGFKVLDTTTLANGTHTIVWVVTDDHGATEGIGSRFFTVANGASAVTTAAASASAVLATADAATLPVAEASLRGRRGFDLAAPYETYAPDGSGRVVVRGEEIDRFELVLAARPGVRVTGSLRTGDGLAPLPIGSTLDPTTGVFTWAPGVGFVGTYDFVFVRAEGGTALDRQEVRIVLQPKGRGAVGPQVVIDIPTSQQNVAQPFMLAGWAPDLGAGSGTGIATVHVWAYPVAGGPPVFVGVADTGGRRPDVGAVHGEQFLEAGYGLVVNALVPGTYDVAVFGFSTVTGDFVPAKVVRVTVR